MGKRGCQQVLLECNHVGCDISDRMRRELSAALQKGDNNDVILHSFVQKYGATVLVTPSMTGVNKLLWIVPSAVFATACIVVAFLRKRQPRPAVVTTTPLSELDGIDVDMLGRRVRAQTENDDW